MEFIDRTINFISETISEMQRVSWPTRKELVSSTVAVIVLCLIMAAFVGLFDLLFSNILAVVLR